MSIPKLRELLLLVLLIPTANQAAAENGALITAFGGDPGSPLPHAYSYGQPEGEDSIYTLRIAMMARDIKGIFYDTVLTISAPDKIVQSVTAARAYRDHNDCNTARDVVLKKLAKSLPREYALAGDEWQLQSADGKVVARVLCAKRRHDPMPILSMEIALQQ